MFVSVQLFDSTMYPYQGKCDEDHLASPNHPNPVNTAIWPIGQTASATLSVEIPGMQVGDMVRVDMGADIVHCVDVDDEDTWVHAGDSWTYDIGIVE
jgi:pyruvate/2-oxoacid:ferredoxin oxidoreductase beta subunit